MSFDHLVSPLGLWRAMRLLSENQLKLKRMRALAESSPRIATGGKPNFEDRTVRVGRSNADRAAVRSDDRADDCEAQSGASLLATRSIRPRKPPEHELSIYRGDPRARVLDGQDDLISHGSQRDVDRSARGRVPAHICQEVVDHLPKPACVALDHERPLGELELDKAIGLRSSRRVDRPLDEIVQRDR
jgi:hypothetical protein